MRNIRVGLSNLVTGLLDYVTLKQFQKLLDSVAEYTGALVKTTPTGEVTATTLDSAIVQLENNKQKKLNFYSAGVLQGTATEIDTSGGSAISIVGNKAYINSGATVDSQNISSNLVIGTSPQQYYSLNPTVGSLLVTLSQPSIDTVTNIFNSSSTNSFTLVANWEGDINYNDTHLLILGESSITDVSANVKTLSLVGETSLSTEQAKFGTQSIKFDGAGDYLSAGTVSNFGFLHDGTNYTIDFWARLTNTTGTLLSTATSDTQKGINIRANGNISGYRGTAGNLIFNGSYTPPANSTWNHYAFVYNGSTFTVYINGTAVSTLTQLNAPIAGNSNTALIIGNQITGYIDAIRITQAVRYTGNFTPETLAPYTYQRVGTYFTQPIVPGINATLIFDPTKGWQLPLTLPQFEFQEEGVDVAAVGQITKINYTGSSITASLAGNVLTVNTNAIPSTEKGVVNGVATLDSNGLIPASQLPVSAMEFKGLWDASTNTPTISDATGNAGDTYDVSIGGTRNLGSGTISFVAGDEIKHNGSIWQRKANTNAVSSVFGRTGIITAQNGDYNASQVTVTPYGNIASNTVQAAIQELDDEKQADIQWQDEGVNQGATGQVNTVNVTGAGATLSVSSGIATLNIPGAGTSPTLALVEQGSDPSSAAGQAVVFAKTDDILYYRQESNGTINQISVLGRSQTYTAAQGTAQVALTDGATISVNAALSNSFTVTLGGNRTLANPTNTVAGFTYVFRIVQDATGSRTLAYGTNYKFPGGTVPTLSTAANAVDILTCYCGVSNGNLNCTLTKDFK